LPYFWDELGVYARSSMYLCKHEIGLQPKYLPPELSRGHPLLLPSLFAGWFLIWGKSVFAGHVLALIISLVFIAFLFLFAAKSQGVVSALGIALMLCLQPLFVAQSALILPEVLLSLFCFAALVFYSQKRFFEFAIVTSFALLTKETALVLPFTALLFTLIKIIFYKDRGEYISLKNMTSIVFPLLIFISFLVLQKRQNGWYLFPMHTDLMSFQFSEIINSLKLYLKFVFIQQGRWLSSGILLLTILFRIVKGEIKISDFSLLAVTFLCIFLAFSSLNFVMMRYMMPAIVVVCVLLVRTISRVSAKLILPIAIVLGLFAYRHMESSSFKYDEDMSYRYQVVSQQKATDYILQITKSTDTIGADFPAYYGFEFPESGYLKNPQQKVCFGLSSKVQYQYYVFANTGENDYLMPSDSSLYLIKAFKEGFCDGRIYERK